MLYCTRTKNRQYKGTDGLGTVSAGFSTFLGQAHRSNISFIWNSMDRHKPKVLVLLGFVLISEINIINSMIKCFP